MNVTVKLFASLRQGRSAEMVIACAIDSTVEVIIRDMGIPLDQVATVLVNDSPVNFGYRLTAGDILSLFPPLAGG